MSWVAGQYINELCNGLLPIPSQRFTSALKRKPLNKFLFQNLSLSLVNTCEYFYLFPSFTFCLLVRIYFIILYLYSSLYICHSQTCPKGNLVNGHFLHVGEPCLFHCKNYLKLSKLNKNFKKTYVYVRNMLLEQPYYMTQSALHNIFTNLEADEDFSNFHKLKITINCLESHAIIIIFFDIGIKNNLNFP